MKDYIHDTVSHPAWIIILGFIAGVMLMAAAGSFDQQDSMVGGAQLFLSGWALLCSVGLLKKRLTKRQIRVIRARQWRWRS